MIGILIACVDMPRNCHECGSLGVSDIVGLDCPPYDYQNRPFLCPLIDTGPGRPANVEIHHVESTPELMGYDK